MITPDLLAVDTETTGLDLRHDCKPFMVTTCDSKGNTRHWEWKVDPTTRQPKIPRWELKEIAGVLENRTLIFHHAKFDIRALETIGIDLYFDDFDWWTKRTLLARRLRCYCRGFHDTLLMSHSVSSEGPHGLKELALQHLGMDVDDERILKKKTEHACAILKSRLGDKFTKGIDLSGHRQTSADYWTVRLADPKDDACLTYALKDVERTMLLYDYFTNILHSKERLPGSDNNPYYKYNTYGYEREMQLLKVVYKMENLGITVDLGTLEMKLADFCKRTIQHESHCRQAMGKALERVANIRSNVDMVEYLFTDRGLGLVSESMTAKGKASCDKAAIEGLIKNLSPKRYKAKEFLVNLLLYKSYATAISYLEGYQHRLIQSKEFYGTLYPSLNQSGTKTTRFSSSNPNGQNVSTIATLDIAGEEYEGHKIRECFSPSPGKLWYSIDYSQLELRVFAKASQEQSLIDALDAGYDFHAFVACKIFDKPQEEITKQERRVAKNVNFALIFGASARRVNETAGIPGAYDLFSKQFPNVASFMEKTIAEAKKDGCVYTLDGYRLDVPAGEPFKSVNYIVQGTAGSIIKNAMIDIDAYRIVTWRRSRMALQIHDELIFEFPSSLQERTLGKKIKRIIDIMEGSGRDLGINTPVSVERIEENWGSGIKVDLSLLNGSQHGKEEANTRNKRRSVQSI